jgi:manganese transport protein
MQLPFAIVPLVMFTADRNKMGELVAPRWTTGLAWIVAVVVIVLNMKVVYDIFAG